ncbi:hypothetical protein CTZ27_31125 [Streptomyces griseocarneus]|nr:hypothetical protein CTZ27_31125 [Streptomyces griseocarneus]
MPSAGDLRAIVSGNPKGYTQRWTFGVPTWRHVSEGGFRKDRYEVVRLDEEAARRYVTEHHYLSGWPAAMHRFGLLDTEAEPGPRDQTVDGQVLVGVTVLASPMNERVLTGPFPHLRPYSQSVELARLVVGESVPANGETFLVSRVLKLAAECGVRGVVSFADPMPRQRLVDNRIIRTSPGHLGIVYQALGARYAGRSTARSLCFLPDGSVLSARSRAKITGGEAGGNAVARRLELLGARPRLADEDPAGWLAEVLPAIGAQAVRHPGNLRYLLPAGRTRGERSRAVFGMPSLPYPKWEADRRPVGTHPAPDVANHDY